MTVTFDSRDVRASSPIPAIRSAARLLRKGLREIAPFWLKRFTTSDDYWKKRYKYGGNSGSGSRGASARYKAEFVSRFCAEHSISRVVEVGCGDGQNCRLLDVERYVGLDISPDALDLARAACRSKPGWAFALISDPRPTPVVELAQTALAGEAAELSLSMDVLYHLNEDETYLNYVEALARISSRYCLVYATDRDWVAKAHVRHRAYSAQFACLNPGWVLRERFANPLHGATSPYGPHFCLFERDRRS